MPTVGEAFGFLIFPKSREAKHFEGDSQWVGEFTNWFLENPNRNLVFYEPRIDRFQKEGDCFK